MKNLFNTKLKDMKAITLIALVITIVVLIILAGVLVSLTLGNNGLFTKAKLSKQKYEYAQAKEILDLKLIDIQTECITNGDEYTLELIANRLKLPVEEAIEIIYYYGTNASEKTEITTYTHIDGIVVIYTKSPNYKFLLGKDANEKIGITGIAVTENEEFNKTDFVNINTFEKSIGFNSYNNNNNNNNNNNTNDTEDVPEEIEAEIPTIDDFEVISNTGEVSKTEDGISFDFINCEGILMYTKYTVDHTNAQKISFDFEDLDISWWFYALDNYGASAVQVGYWTTWDENDYPTGTFVKTDVFGFDHENNVSPSAGNAKADSKTLEIDLLELQDKTEYIVGVKIYRNDIYDRGTRAKGVLKDIQFEKEDDPRMEVYSLTPGTYKLEVWGAQGGNAYTYTGGYGGYSVGEITLTQTETVYAYIGTQGESDAVSNNGEGGYNGGGNSVRYSRDSANYTAGGGGATHIATVPGKLEDLISYKDTGGTNISNEILIVAGGGGGAYYHTNGAAYSARGGDRRRV